MTTVTVQAVQKFCSKSHGKESLKRKAFRRSRRTGIEGGTWHVGADCSKYGQQQQGRPDHRWWTTVHNGH